MPAGKATSEALSFPDVGGPQDFATALLVVVGVVVVAVIVIPLLLFGIELIVLGFLVAVAIVGRGLLGRPWIIQATRGTDAPPTLTWAVSGWRRSARLIDEVATELAAGRDPAPNEADELAGATTQ
jgi:hypothetical protein